MRLAQPGQRGRHLVERERKPPAQIERCGVVIESQCPDGHGGDYKIEGAFVVPDGLRT